MKRDRHPDEGRGALDLLEEATHLVRGASAATLATYYVGSIPFALGFLYYWVDMERSPFASEHLAEGALAVTALFFWMKFCQASFTRRIREQLSAKPFSRLGFRQSVRVFFSQAVIQSSGLFLIPISLILVIPFAWVYGFYQSATALADPDSGEISRQVRHARKQISLWVLQNHTVIGLGFLLGLCVLLNWALVAFSLPYVLKSLFGIETAFSRNPIAMLNTTFLGGVFALTYLSVDPIVKAVYALRCFYGESLHSGEDLKADLKHLQAAKVALLILLTLSAALVAKPAFALAQNPPIVASPGISPEQLDQRIETVIHQRKYTWRTQRGTVIQEPRQKGVIARFAERIFNMAGSAIRAVFRWIGRLLRWVFGNADPSVGSPASGWMRPSVLLYVLLAIVVVALAIVVLRNRRRPTVSPLATATPADKMPDVTDESVSADQLPEDDWVRMARALMEEGELRLAMRAFYLATLAHLARRGLLHIARFKSNRDYENELRRRAHSIPNLVPLFGENLSVFERIWYGAHAVDRDLVLRFADTVDRIKAGA